jgi:hypothetical protein
MSKIRARDGSACDGGPACQQQRHSYQPNHRPRLRLVNHWCKKMTRLHFTIQPITQHQPQKPHFSTNRTLLSAFCVCNPEPCIPPRLPSPNPINHPNLARRFSNTSAALLACRTGNRDIQTPTHPNAMHTRDHTNHARSLHLAAEKHHCSSSSSSSSEFGCCGQCDGLGTADGSSDGNGFRPQTTYLVWRQQHPFHHS